MDVGWSDGRLEQVANAPEEIKVFSDRVKAAGISLVVVEASGGYEQLALLTIYRSGVPAVAANPRLGA